MYKIKASAAQLTNNFLLRMCFTYTIAVLSCASARTTKLHMPEMR